jgi:hypothetical protein
MLTFTKFALLILMKWLRYQRVISLETQVRITSQIKKINKWALHGPPDMLEGRSGAMEE